MRHLTLASSLALAFAAMLLAPAKADMGGPLVEKGMCRMFNGNNQNNTYSYLDKCPKKSAEHKVKHSKKG
jgi:hypothetical protein